MNELFFSRKRESDEELYQTNAGTDIDDTV